MEFTIFFFNLHTDSCSCMRYSLVAGIVLRLLEGHHCHAQSPRRCPVSERGNTGVHITRSNSFDINPMDYFICRTNNSATTSSKCQWTKETFGTARNKVLLNILCHFQRFAFYKVACNAFKVWWWKFVHTFRWKFKSFSNKRTLKIG